MCFLPFFFCALTLLLLLPPLLFLLPWLGFFPTTIGEQD
jgi:hypothetical protein